MECSAYYPRLSSFVIILHHKVSGLNISRTIWPRITTFYSDIHTDLLYSHTSLNYFRSAFIEVRKMPPGCFRLNFCIAAFCLAQPICWVLVWTCCASWMSLCVFVNATCDQMTYSMTRFGIYETVKQKIDTPGVVMPFAGCVGGFVGTPADMVNVRWVFSCECLTRVVALQSSCL